MLLMALDLWRHGLTRARMMRADGGAGDRPRDLGASALEWAVISAILVTAAVIIGGIVVAVVRQKGQDLQNCANQPVGANGC